MPCKAQKERTYNWFFGRNASLNFSVGITADTVGQLDTNEGCSSISDTCGNLLFYTDGITVWNSQHDTMENGTGLMGCWSATQSALIVPQPDVDSIYFIFTAPCNGTYLRYSTVDIRRNEGLGKVIEKNTNLFLNTSEKLAAVHHCNNKDVWVVGKPQIPTNEYNAFLVTESGINPTPVVSTVAYVSSYNDNIGCLKFSSDGEYLANAYTYPTDTVLLMTFDNCSGTLTELMTFQPDTALYGVSFSPDNSKLYISNTLSSLPQLVTSKVYQYDLTSSSPSTIQSTETIVAIADDSLFFGNLQQGPDGKIYCANYNYNGGVDFLGVIQNPNTSGIACSFEDSAITLNGKTSLMGLPNFVESYFNRSSLCDQMTSSNQTEYSANFELYPNPTNNHVRLKFVNELVENQTLSIYDAQGKLVRTFFDITNNELIIETNELPGGLYFLTLVNDRNVGLTKKLIVE